MQRSHRPARRRRHLEITAGERGRRKSAGPVAVANGGLPLGAMRAVQVEGGPSIFELSAEMNARKLVSMDGRGRGRLRGDTDGVLLAILTSTTHEMPTESLKSDDVIRGVESVAN